MDTHTIEQLIRTGLPDAEVSVSSEDNVHFHARVVTPAFSGQNRVERHRQVHAAIGEALGREIHALSLELKSPEELADTGQAD